MTLAEDLKKLREALDDLWNAVVEAARLPQFVEWLAERLNRGSRAWRLRRGKSWECPGCLQANPDENFRCFICGVGERPK